MWHCEEGRELSAQRELAVLERVWGMAGHALDDGGPWNGRGTVLDTQSCPIQSSVATGQAVE